MRQLARGLGTPSQRGPFRAPDLLVSTYKSALVSIVSGAAKVDGPRNTSMLLLIFAALLPRREAKLITGIAFD